MLKGSLALLVALLALAAFLLLRPEGHRSEVSPQVSEGASATGVEVPERVRPEDSDLTRVETIVREPEGGELSASPGEGGLDPQEGTVTVTVRDETGAPLSGAEVWPELSVPSELMGFEPDGDAARTEEARQRFLEWSRLRAQVASRVVTTDASGTTVLEGLAWGSLVAKATREGKVTSSSERVTLSEEQPAARVEIVLPAGGEVAGELRDVHGTPVEGVTLLLHRSDRGSSPGRTWTLSATTEALGTFAFVDVEPGTWVLRMGVLGDLPAGVLAQEVELEVLAGQTTFVSLPQPIGDHVQVTGRVLRNGTPLADARVRASLVPIRVGAPSPRPRPTKPGASTCCWTGVASGASRCQRGPRRSRCRRP